MLLRQPIPRQNSRSPWFHEDTSGSGAIANAPSTKATTVGNLICAGNRRHLVIQLADKFGIDRIDGCIAVFRILLEVKRSLWMLLLSTEGEQEACPFSKVEPTLLYKEVQSNDASPTRDSSSHIN